MERESKYNTLMFVVFAILSTLIGAMLQFMDTIEGKTLCMILCGIILFVGIVNMCKFFFTKAYTRSDDYSFTVGTILLILGFCGLIRVNEIVPFILTILILPSLLIGMIIFQFAIQLKLVEHGYWKLLMGICAVLTLCSTLLLLGVKIGNIQTMTNYLLMVSGVVGLLCYIYTSFLLSKHRKEHIPPHHPMHDEPHHEHNHEHQPPRD